jgi:hypothetical protein
VELTVVLMLFVLFIVSLLFSWLPLLSTVGKITFTVFTMFLAFTLAFYMFNIEIVNPAPMLDTVTVTGWENATKTGEASGLVNQTDVIISRSTAYTYIVNQTLTTVRIADTYPLSYLFLGIGLIMLVRVFALGFVLMAEGFFSRGPASDEEDLDEA